MQGTQDVFIFQYDLWCLLPFLLPLPQVSAADERQRSSELTSQLSVQVASLTQKCSILSQELDQKDGLLHTFKKYQDDTLKTTEDRESQLQIALAEKTELERKMDVVMRESEITKQERDHYAGLVDKKTKEVSSLRDEDEKLRTQLVEVKGHARVLGEQNTNMAHLVEASAKSSDELQEEKASLQQRLEEHLAETERLKVTMEDVERRLKVKERKAEEVEVDNGRLMEEVEAKMRDVEEVIASKEKMLTELREAKLEVNMSPAWILKSGSTVNLDQTWTISIFIYK